MTRPAGLKDYQVVISSGILYRVWAQASRAPVVANSSAAQLRPNIEIIGDTCDVYGSQIEPDVAPTGMPVIINDLEGIAPFDFVPNYLYVDGDPDSIVLTGLMAEAIIELSAKNQIVVYIKANLVAT